MNSKQTKTLNVTMVATDSSSRSNFPGTELHDDTAEDERHQEAVRIRKDAIPFPLKLYRLLDNAETLAFDDAIAWMPDGRSFRVFDKVKFEQVVMPQYFSTGKFKSFQRSLNLWGFQTAKKTSPYLGREHGCRFHPMFVRGQIELCYQMQRIRIKLDDKKSKAKKRQGSVITIDGAQPSADEEEPQEQDNLRSPTSSLSGGQSTTSESAAREQLPKRRPNDLATPQVPAQVRQISSPANKDQAPSGDVLATNAASYCAILEELQQRREALAKAEILFAESFQSPPLFLGPSKFFISGNHFATPASDVLNCYGPTSSINTSLRNELPESTTFGVRTPSRLGRISPGHFISSPTIRGWSSSAPKDKSLLNTTKTTLRKYLSTSGSVPTARL